MRLISLFLCILLAIPALAQQKPNVVLLFLDDLGWKDVGFMGSKYYETPYLDSLAKQGMVFTDAYASASNCAPSRACMLSGRWTPRHGIYTVSNSERGNAAHRKLVPIENTTTLDPKFKTLAQSLKENGYTTCVAGKWHLSEDPIPYGFDFNIGGSHAGHPTSYYPPYKNVKLEGLNDDYLTDEVTDRAIDFVNSTSKEKPFFLYYSTYAVHTPIQKVDSLMHKFVNKKPDQGQQNAEYATMVNNVDRNIGRLMKTLKEKGVLDNTIIIFTSDNGGPSKITSQQPLRSGKGSYFEGGTRVPLAVVWKGKIKAGTISDLPVTNLDFYPTILDVAGIKPTVDLDGTSFCDYLFTQQVSQSLAKRSLFWYFPIYLQDGDEETNDPIFRTRPGETIRRGDWKLHHYFEDNSVQLYNLKEDVGERNNLAAQNPQKVTEMMTLLKTWKEQTKAPAVTELNKAYKGKSNSK